MADDATLAGVIRKLVQPLADPLGAEVDDVVVRGSAGSRVVRVVVDRADGGIDLGTCERLSRALGSLLDERDVIDGRYTLEVTSPGADRPLRQQRDFRRNLGRVVRIAHAARGPQHPPTGEIVGVVRAVDDSAVTLEVDDEEVAVPLDEVAHGKVVLPW